MNKITVEFKSGRELLNTIIIKEDEINTLVLGCFPVINEQATTTAMLTRHQLADGEKVRVNMKRPNNSITHLLFKAE